MKQHNIKTKIMVGAAFAALLVVTGVALSVRTTQTKYAEQAAATIASSRAQLAQEMRATGAFPEVALRGKANHEEAISRLADRLPEVAAWYGFSPTELRDMFRKDRSLWVDEEARLFYADEVPPEIEAGSVVGGVETTLSLGALYPLEDTFLLHSKPGAKRVIYLDFDGMLISGKIWNSSYNSGADIVAPAWDIDGNRAVFGTTERERIQRIWQRVSEDYAPFDVDVTTEEPPADRIARTSTSDEYYGTVALISPISSYFGNYGGLAYVGIYNSTNNSYYQPALVFSEKLLNSEKYIAEAVSHEVGHNLGLNHDGTTDGTTYYTGHGVWAPIMGNSYYKTVSQWSIGEYANANNKQDDIAIIASKGPSVRTDDCGATRTTTCSVSYNAGTISGSGLIEARGDVDMFKVMSDAGTVAFSVSLHPSAPNLYVRVSLQDEGGRVLATAADTYSKASISTAVTAGTYYIVVQAVGSVDVSDYASLGQYQIAGTVTYSNNLPPVAAASANPTSGSAPLTVQFSSAGSYDPDGALVSYVWDFGDGTASNETDPQKSYTASGTYTVTLTVADAGGFSDMVPLSVSVVNTPPVALMSASSLEGAIPLEVTFSASDSYDPDGSIVNYIWSFGDGTQGSGETVTHTYMSGGTFVAQLTVTDSDGKSDTAALTIVATNPNTVVAPSNLQASAGKGSVSLSWTDNSSNETEFRVYRWLEMKRTTPVYTQVGSTGANATSYDESVSSGTYYYYVEAVNDATGSSAASSPVKVRVR